jgi:hypothetical protein
MQGFGMFNDTTLRQARQAGATPNVVSAVRQASASTGVDFSYLMEKAAVESGFNPDAKASTSSATGLYQFTESTWLDTIAQHGAEHGLGKFASEISYGSDGNPTVTNAADRQKILDLRKDPAVAAAMAAELAKDNKTALQSTVGGQIGGTELYLAHFLGAGGAAKFLEAYRQNPSQPATSVLPDAAAANPSVFTDSSTGKPCTLAQIYDRFAAHFGGSNFLNGSNANSCNLTPTNGTLGNWTSGQDLADRAIPGVGGPTLSLYAILTLSSLNVPTQAGEEAIKGKNDPYRAGNMLVGL